MSEPSAADAAAGPKAPMAAGDESTADKSGSGERSAAANTAARRETVGAPASNPTSPASPPNGERSSHPLFWWYQEFKNFFSTGLFYIVLGIGFLWISFQNLESHPAFIFLLVILGVAIVLYGTGTQATGSGNTGQMNIAIAGGAGVLAAFFGFGVM